MKKLILLLPCFLLNGCFYQSINTYDLMEAEEFCKDHKGIAYITSSFEGTEKVTCNDTTYKSLHIK